MFRHIGYSGLAALALICSTGELQAQTFTGSSGSLAASATFTLSGGNLDIIFRDTATSPAGSNADVLTGLFFDVSGSPIFNKASSSIDTNGSIFVNTSNNSPTGVIGDHWAFKQGLKGTSPTPPGNANYGISATGLGIFGPSDTFTGNGGSPDGVDYGLVGPGGPGGVNHNQGPQLQNSVHIVLSDSLSGSATISNVWFQYGSALTETSIHATVPAPPSLVTALIGAGLLGVGFRINRRKTSRRVTAS